MLQNKGWNRLRARYYVLGGNFKMIDFSKKCKQAFCLFLVFMAGGVAFLIDVAALATDHYRTHKMEASQWKNK